LSEFAVIVNCTLNKGGTWAGAIENIKKKWVPTLVNKHSSDKEGNNKLINMGAKYFPKNFNDKFIEELISDKNKLKSEDKNTKKQLKLF